MITVGDLYGAIDAIAPFSSAQEFDNPGLLVGSARQQVSRVLLALDITPEVVREAAESGAQLIVSHHPVIFHPVRSLSAESVPYLLAQNRIAAICAHTNLDMAPQWGVNAALADALGLQDVRAMTKHNEYAETVIGRIPELAPRDFAAFVKQKLNRPALEYCEGNRSVCRVALCSGAGGEFVADAVRAGADAFVTGEVKHHEWLLARENGLTVVCASHFGTENIVLERLQRFLQGRFPELQLKKAESSRDPVCWM